MKKGGKLLGSKSSDSQTEA